MRIPTLLASEYGGRACCVSVRGIVVMLLLVAEVCKNQVRGILLRIFIFLRVGCVIVRRCLRLMIESIDSPNRVNADVLKEVTGLRGEFPDLFSAVARVLGKEIQDNSPPPELESAAKGKKRRRRR